jgi:hypothetical protein
MTDQKNTADVKGSGRGGPLHTNGKVGTKSGIMTGAAILWECLEREGVKQVFGYPGGAILPAYDALKHSNIHHILVGFGHAADAAGSQGIFPSHL